MTGTSTRVLRGQRVVTGSGSGTDVGPRALHLDRGQIVAVTSYHDVPAGAPMEDVGDLVLMAGLVDTHVHINDPGRSDWEGFETATRAAAAGGVTTLVDMPLNAIPPTTSVKNLEVKAAAADGNTWVDVGLCGGAVPGNSAELVPMLRAGAMAFKCFLAESGVDEFKHLDAEGLALAMRALADQGVPLLVHAELPGPLDEAARTLKVTDPRRYTSYLASRPRSAEDAAVDLVVRLAGELRARAHVVHLSSADALSVLRRAREGGAHVSAETCPHYLHFTAESVPDGATAFKCAPPIREAENRDRLWDALREGLIEQVVTDHSPAPAALKCVGSGDFMQAWGGISSLQLGLAVVWSEARTRGGKLQDIARWMCQQPSELAGLTGQKGIVAPGADADLVAWDPDGQLAVTAAALEHRHKITPYEGERLRGRVHTTWLRGEKVYEAGRHLGTPRGKLLRRRAS